MNNPTASLLPEGTPDLAPLVASMRRTTNSYKHLVLRSVVHHTMAGGDFIPYGDLFRGMLAEAWWPAFHYRLSLGRQDKVVRYLESVIAAPDDLRLRPGEVRDFLKTIPFDPRRELATGLLRYVPQRLIAPWFVEQTRSLPDARRNGAIRDLSNSEFDTARPLYRIEADGIRLHSDWAEIIRTCSGVFSGWTDAIWIAYLENRNPHAIGLLTKIKPAFERGSLTDERRIWMAARIANPICIYTGQPVNPDLFELDHFLAHSFTGHDRFWNLTPMPPSLNAAKRDGVPPQDLVPALARQHATLWQSANRLPDTERALLLRTRDDYASDLGLSDPQQTTEAEMIAAYEATYPPLIAIARRMGFPDWAPAGF